ncbi:zinc ribbon domain-containing protein [Reyranella sp. MMS21-HV4-11]|uniref:Zinc ribbon domain-containing protein n=2 Tax=Reyranella humidisoli TaxID=2849149 RepID=A0ABS6II92_9HYPH|nr:zinc ribbon domain-containing protein [Reyranella sp. MMS21-HV4-11]
MRAPKFIAPRNVNGPTMLVSVVRCGGCGSAMIPNTGKGGTYRYYSCSQAMKQGRPHVPAGASVWTASTTWF